MSTSRNELFGFVLVGAFGLGTAACGDDPARAEATDTRAPVVDSVEPAVNAGRGAIHSSFSPQAARAKAIPGQIIVKFKSSGPERLTECSATWLRNSRSFATATADGSPSLDSLMLKHQVLRGRPLLRGRLGLSTAAATARFSARFSGLRAARGKGPWTRADLVNVYRLEVPVTSNLEAVAAEFQRDPHVEYAHPNYEAHAIYSPNDPYLSSGGSWGQAEPDLWNLQYVGAQEAWDSARGAGVVVAVLDSGLDLTHPDIAGNVWQNADEVPGNGVDDDGNGYVDDVSGWDTNGDDNDPTDGFGHGTHVAGTIAAQDDNGEGVVGLAPDAQIMPIKGLSDAGSGTLFDLAEGLVYAAANGADVINNSWGCRGGCPSVPVIEEAVTAAYSAGTVVVFAAGNDDQDVRGYSPENRPEPIVVSAVNPLLEKASFSNFGFVDVGAPGAGTPGTSLFEPERGILSLKSAVCAPEMCPPELIVGGEYLRQAGTSMAAPHVAALAALILSQHPEYTPEQVRQVIRRSATDIGGFGFDTEFGYGFIDASAAMLEEAPLGALLLAPPLIEEGTSFPLLGTASGPDFASYVVEYGEGASPSFFTAIATSSTPVESGLLANWAVSAVPDGEYTLRLRAVTTDGREYEDRVLVLLDRVIVTSPVSMSVEDGDPITIVGTAASAGLDHFSIRVERLPDGAPLTGADITLTGNGTSPVENGVLGVWNPTNVPADHYRIVLEVTMQSGLVLSDGVSLIVDRRAHEGWPIELDHGGELGVPIAEHAVVADLDGDGLAENIVGYGRQVNVFRHDGSQLPGWPQTVNPDGVPSAIVWEAPAVGDVNGDDELDVVLPANDGRLWVWHANGVVHDAFPQQRAFARHDVTLADVDRDGTLDIVLTDFVNGVDVIRGNGESLPGFPVPAFGLTGPATAADLDGDGDLEIVAALSFGGPFDLVAWSHTGAPLPGFPVNVAPTSTSGAHPVVGDLDDDGDLEIAVAAAGFSDINAGVVAAYHHTGLPLAGFPKSFTAFQMSPPVLADLDGDGSLEVLAGVSEAPAGLSALYVWNGAGVQMPGWPVFNPPSITFTVTPFMSPIVFNADADHRSEVVVARIHDHFSADLFMPFGHPVQGFEHDGVSIPDLARPAYGQPTFGAWDMAPGVGDLDGDGLLEMVWLEDRIVATGKVFAHLWDLDVPANAKQSWSMFRSDARHSGVAEKVVPIVELSAADRNQPRSVNGLARFRVKTGNHGIIQIVHPHFAQVKAALGSDALSPLPQAWGGPIQAQPFTEYVVRVVTPSPMTIRVDWW